MTPKKLRVLISGLLVLCVASLTMPDIRGNVWEFERWVMEGFSLSALVALAGAWACGVWLWSDALAGLIKRTWWVIPAVVLTVYGVRIIGRWMYDYREAKRSAHVAQRLQAIDAERERKWSVHPLYPLVCDFDTWRSRLSSSGAYDVDRALDHSIEVDERGHFYTPSREEGKASFIESWVISYATGIEIGSDEWSLGDREKRKAEILQKWGIEGSAPDASSFVALVKDALLDEKRRSQIKPFNPVSPKADSVNN